MLCNPCYLWSLLTVLIVHADICAGIAIFCLYSALATRWPRLHRLSPWFDEAFLVVSLLVESRFLANHTCLLSESFYGLRRCRYGPNNGPPGERHLSFVRAIGVTCIFVVLTISFAQQETPREGVVARRLCIF